MTIDVQEEQRIQLRQLGMALQYARRAEDAAMADALAAVPGAVTVGLSEVEVGALLGVSRMTVRKALGKLPASV